MKNREISPRLKMATHLACIFAPASLLGMFVFAYEAPSKVAGGMVALAIYTALLYGIAGGSDWKLEEISRVRLFFFLFLSGFYGGILFYVLWYVIRKFVADMFNTPFELMKGKLFSGKWF
jgi:hypothetical protein